MSSRREFLHQMGAAAAAAALPGQVVLRSLDAGGEKQDIRFAYAAITWGDDDRRAIAEVSGLGFPGVQLRANVLTDFARPEALRAVLAEHHLTFVALSSGNVPIEGTAAADVAAEHAAHARYLRRAGGHYLQLIDERPRGRAIETADFRTLGRLLTDIGKRAAEEGVATVYHPHMGSLGEKPEAVDRILDAADPRYVHLLLDVAHYQQGGGDPVAAVHKYRERLLTLHIKDVRERTESAGPSYRFVELGRGTVDLPGVFRALREVRFRGWAIVELDSVPEPGRTPAESAAISKRYIEDVLHLRVSA